MLDKGVCVATSVLPTFCLDQGRPSAGLWLWDQLILGTQRQVWVSFLPIMSDNSVLCLNSSLFITAMLSFLVCQIWPISTRTSHCESIYLEINVKAGKYIFGQQLPHHSLRYEWSMVDVLPCSLTHYLFISLFCLPSQISVTNKKFLVPSSAVYIRFLFSPSCLCLLSTFTDTDCMVSIKI